MTTTDETKASLKARRITLGLSIQQIATIYDVSVNYIYRIEASNTRTWASNAPKAYIKLLDSLEAGDRPPGWPAELKAGKRGRPRRVVSDACPA